VTSSLPFARPTSNVIADAFIEPFVAVRNAASRSPAAKVPRSAFPVRLITPANERTTPVAKVADACVTPAEFTRRTPIEADPRFIFAVVMFKLTEYERRPEPPLTPGSSGSVTSTYVPEPFVTVQVTTIEDAEPGEVCKSRLVLPTPELRLRSDCESVS
jgi:hypothetical protein